MIALWIAAGLAAVVGLSIPYLQQRPRRRCERGIHRWAYSGEVHDTPRYRDCVICGLSIDRGLLVEQHNPLNPLMIRVVEGEIPENDWNLTTKASTREGWNGARSWGEPVTDPWTALRMRRRA